MEQSWFPTHLRVTVIGARNLRAKGKDGLNDCYTVIRLGSDKYMTSVQSGTLSPEWKEECTLQLPLVLDNSDRWTLHLTVKHNNSRLPVDAFLGHVALPIAHLYEDKSRRRSELGTCELSLMAHATKPKYDGECICVTDHGRLGNPFCYTVMWYDLQSKPNKAAKNRGQLQLAFEFLRNNTTASSYELFKRRPQSVFDKFKDKVTSIKYGMTHEILPSEKPSTANGSYSGAPLAPSSLKHHKNGKMSKSLSYAQMDSRAEMLNAPGIGTQTGSEVLSLVFHKHSGDEQPKVHLKMADVHTDSADQSQSDKIATLKLEEASVLKLHSNNVEHMFPKCATEADRSYVSATHSSPLEKTKPRHFEDNPRLASFVIAGGGRDVSFEGWKVKPTTCCTHCFHQANSKSR